MLLDDIILVLVPTVIIAIAVIVILLYFIYTVVKPSEAHVVVTQGKGRKLYTSRPNEKSSYWYVPLWMKRTILPLGIVKLQIENISLRDSDMAKFLGDVRVWLNIENPELAAEKLGTGDYTQTLTTDVKDLIESITRNESMKMDVISIMRDRAKFSTTVRDEIKPVLLGEWGIKIADLEVIHFKDLDPYHVIADIEERQAKVIEAETRKQVADQEKDAVISEQRSLQDRETQKAQAEQAYKSAQLEAQKQIGIADQQRAEEIAKATMDANKQAVESMRALDVGTAEVGAQAVVKTAEGAANAVKTKADGDAQAIKLTGFAQADVNQAQLFATAAGTEKQANALKLYNDAGLSIEIIHATLQSQIAKWAALGDGLKVAKISIVQSGESQIFGIPLSAEVGADIGMMIKALEAQGVDVSKVLDALPIGSVAKEAIKANLAKNIVKQANQETKKAK
ncbi:MAG: SPFH domain-containing protein [Candidatus Bathyarchaeia archaeon]|jgi:flotillin